MRDQSTLTKPPMDKFDLILECPRHRGGNGEKTRAPRSGRSKGDRKKTLKASRSLGLGFRLCSRTAKINFPAGRCLSFSLWNRKRGAGERPGKASDKDIMLQDQSMEWVRAMELMYEGVWN